MILSCYKPFLRTLLYCCLILIISDLGIRSSLIVILMSHLCDDATFNFENPEDEQQF